MRRCNLDGCTQPHHARGWCGLHYNRWRRHGDPNQVHAAPDVCETRHCDSPHHARGMCLRHYRRWQQTQGQPCTVDGCHGVALARGWCPAHYQRWREHGTTFPQIPLGVWQLPEGTVVEPDDACESCGGPADCSGECRWCRDCFHRWADRKRRETSVKLSRATTAHHRRTVGA